MQYRTLGRTDIEVSVIAMGCWGIAGGFNWGHQEESASIAAIEAAVAAGINFFDTAPAYGDGYSEQLLGRILGNRDDVVIATKIMPDDLVSSEAIKASCDASLQRLRRDRIDLYQLHWPNWEVPFADVVNALESLRDAGKVRAIGVSNFGPRDLGDVLDVGRVETNQVMYNLIGRGIEFEIQPVCVHHLVGILCYSPMLMGLLAGKFASADEVPDDRARTRHFSSNRPFTRHGEPGHEPLTFATIDRIRTIAAGLDLDMAQLSTSWCLHQPGVGAVLPGARNAAQATRNAAAADITLSDEVLRELSEATDELKQAMGANPDPWQTASQRTR